MKLVGIFLAAGIGLVAFKAGIILAAIVTPAILMWLAMSNPYQFWGHAILFSFIVWANAHPALGLAILGSALGIGISSKYLSYKAQNPPAISAENYLQRLP